jgi:hypothetical protein
MLGFLNERELILRAYGGGTFYIERYDVAAGEGVYRAHVAGDLMVWLETNPDTGESGELRWAYLPLAGNKLSDR